MGAMVAIDAMVAMVDIFSTFVIACLSQITCIFSFKTSSSTLVQFKSWPICLNSRRKWNSADNEFVCMSYQGATPYLWSRHSLEHFILKYQHEAFSFYFSIPKFRSAEI